MGGGFGRGRREGAGLLAGLGGREGGASGENCLASLGGVERAAVDEGREEVKGGEVARETERRETDKGRGDVYTCTVMRQ